MPGHVLRRHELQQLDDVALEASGVPTLRIGERHRHATPRAAALTFDPRHVHFQPDGLRADRQRPPLSPESFDDMHVTASAGRTPQRPPRSLDPHNDRPHLIPRGHVTVATNAERVIQQTCGHAGFLLSGIDLTKLLMKSACPLFTSKHTYLQDETKN